MKKRTMALLLSLVLSLSVLACGNEGNTETKQEQTQQQEETKEEETKQEEQQQSETEPEEQQEESTSPLGFEATNGDIVIKVEDLIPKYDLSSIQFSNVSGTITPEEEVPIYCNEGYQIGYISPGATVEITQKMYHSAWFRFPNPIEGTPYDYIYVLKTDTDMSNVVDVPGGHIEGDYPFEIKNEYEENEAWNVFSTVLVFYGMIPSEEIIMCQDNCSCIIVIPYTDTVTWSEEKAKLLEELGVAYAWCDNSSVRSDSEGVLVRFRAMNYECESFTREELEQIFTQ